MQSLFLGTLLALMSSSASAQIEAQTTFQHCDDCPEMVMLPPGAFVMGQPESESQNRRFGWGGPPADVTIDTPFAIGRTEVTRAQFKTFLDETGYALDQPCGTVWRAQVAEVFGEDAKPTWQNPLFPGGDPPADNHPMVCVGWPDAQAYVDWLNSKSQESGTNDGWRYHLPSEAQWEYAARAGTTTSRPWGGPLEDSCTYANIGDTAYGAAIGSETVDCTDGYAFTSPVGSFPANGFGLHDMMGNVWEWTQDCWVEDLTLAPRTENPIDATTGDCTKRVMRGGGFSSEEWYVRVTTRGADPVPNTRLVLLGLRVAATQTGPKTAAEGFAPIAFMAGSCWEGPLPGFVAESTGVGPRSVTHCVNWRLENQILTDTLYLDGLDPPVRGETNYYWDPESQVLRYIFWSVGGSYSVGTMRASGDTLIFDDERLVGGSRGTVHFLTTWTPDGGDAFIQDRRRYNADGTWTDSEASRFMRQPLR